MSVRSFSNRILRDIQIKSRLVATLCFAVSIESTLAQSEMDSFGSQQLAVLVSDRPDLKPLVDENREVSQWLRAQFETNGERGVYWDHREPTGAVVQYLPATREHPAFLNVTSTSSIPPLEKLAQIVYQLNRVESLSKKSKIHDGARTDEQSLMEFVTAMLQHDFEVMLKAKRFLSEHDLLAGNACNACLLDDLRSMPDNFKKFEARFYGGPPFNISDICFYSYQIAYDELVQPGAREVFSHREPASHDLEGGIREWFADRFSIDVVSAGLRFPVVTHHVVIDGVDATQEEADGFARVLKEEFKDYPVELVKRSLLKRIVLCKELSFNGMPITGVPHDGSNTIYLDVTRCPHEFQRRQSIHHEFFHVIDFRDDGFADDVWASLNPVGFKYSSVGGVILGSDDTLLFTTKFPGFLNHYSTTSGREDKAEVFAVLMACCEYLDRRSEFDRVLFVKVQQMKKLLAEFCPAMNDHYWQELREKRERSIWNPVQKN